MRKTQKLLILGNKFHHAFCMKIDWLCHLQVVLSCAGCHSQVAISCAQKALKKAAHKNVDEICPWKILVLDL
jgi:hypothetical protein